MNSMTDLLRHFFELSDEFGRVQFESAVSGGSDDAVVQAHSRLIEGWRSISFETPEHEALKQKWIDWLDGKSGFLGFPQFETKNLPPSNRAEFLSDERKKVDTKFFLSFLIPFKGHRFDELGLNLNVLPKKWNQNEDVPLDQEIDPKRFSNQLFEVTGFDPGKSQHHFVRSARGNFFMVNQYNGDHYIGYGLPNTLFKLSSLAHEIGHSTYPQKKTLLEEFLTIASEKDSMPIANEMESYQYEAIFMRSLDCLLPGNWSDAEIKAFQSKLRKRKAIRFNLHLLANSLTYLYYSGSEIDSIEEEFLIRMKEIFPAYRPSEPDEWLQYASLSQPTFEVGYLRAYESAFKR
jgi:hypothetical protein